MKRIVIENKSTCNLYMNNVFGIKILYQILMND